MNIENRIIIETLQSGGVIVMPSDTVYGLMCSALLPKAVKRMYEVKQRENKPGTILASNVQQLIDMGFSEPDVMQATLYWPAAISVVLNAPDSLAYLHMGMNSNSLAVRIPAPKWLRDLLEQTGPLATTSANLPGEPTVATIKEAKKIFGEKVDMYVDGGEIKNIKPSKILKIHDDGEAETLRD